VGKVIELGLEAKPGTSCVFFLSISFQFHYFGIVIELSFP